MPTLAIHSCLALAVLAAYVASLYGWGRAAARLSYGDSHVPWGFAAALGVAVWIFFGGILSALGLVSAYALHSIVCLGLLLSCAFLWTWSRSRSARTPRADSLRGGESAPTATGRGERLLRIGCYACLALVLIFLTLTVLPIRYFHIHDDMMIYLPRVVRIVQAGSINDLFDPVGFDSLGAQPFLQAFVYTYFPLPYIYGCDFVLCYLLCAVLVLELARELAISWGQALLAMLLFLSIRIPEQNASPVYTGSLMTLLALLATCRLGKAAAGNEKHRYRAAIPIGLALAGLLALKLNTALFAGCYFLLLFAGLMLLSGKDRRRIGLGLSIGLATAAATAPWMIAYAGKYMMMFRADPYAAGSPRAAETVYASGMRNLWAMFSPDRHWELSSLLDYLVLMVLAGGALLVALVRLRRAAGKTFWGSLACAAAAGAVVISSVLWQFFGLDCGSNMRYLGPLAAAVLPAAALCLVAAANASMPKSGSTRPSPAWRWSLVVAVLEAFVIGLFFDTTVYRAQHAWSAQNSVPELSAGRMHMIEHLAPPGTRILAWVKAPLLLDFAGNEMCLVYQSGLLSPWLDFPSVANEHTADEFFQRYGIRFLLRERMEHNFPTGDDDINGIRSSSLANYHRIGSRFAILRDLFKAAQRHHKVIYDDGRIVMIDLAK